VGSRYRFTGRRQAVMLDAGYALIENQHLQAVQNVIENRESGIEHQVATATRPPVTGARQPQTAGGDPYRDCLTTGPVSSI